MTFINLHRHIIFLVAICLMVPVISQAKIESYQFDDAMQEESYKKMIAELRCLVCQNQNLADSNAELAQDMRRKVYEMVSQGKSEEEIASFMVARYGDFVLYEPPLKSETILLWFGPLVFLFIAAIIVTFYLRSQKAGASTLSQEQKDRAHSLLNKD